MTALIDPNLTRASSVIEGKRQSFVESAYRDTELFRTIDDYHSALQSRKGKDPQSVVMNRRLLHVIDLMQCHRRRVPSGLPRRYHERHGSRASAYQVFPQDCLLH